MRIIFRPCFAVAIVATLAPFAAQASGRQTFMIPESAGYGIAECFTGERDCARVVADAWCEAHGLGPVIAYGRAEDNTASIAAESKHKTMTAALENPSPGTIIISCGE